MIFEGRAMMKTIGCIFVE
jgi:hypothetical protein